MTYNVVDGCDEELIEELVEVRSRLINKVACGNWSREETSAMIVAYALMRKNKINE